MKQSQDLKDIKVYPCGKDNKDQKMTTADKVLLKGFRTAVGVAGAIAFLRTLPNEATGADAAGNSLIGPAGTAVLACTALYINSKAVREAVGEIGNTLKKKFVNGVANMQNRPPKIKRMATKVMSDSKQQAVSSSSNNLFSMKNRGGR